ncbi:MAG: hypothetical protein ACTHJU_14575, partial [Sphingopyxis sp.]
PSYVSIQSHVFTPICSVCHAGGAAPQGLRLDEANAYAMTVDVASAEVPSLKRIAPGDPDHSFLIYRLESTEPGIAMPELGRSTVHKEGAALLRQWIAEMPKGE